MDYISPKQCNTIRCRNFFCVCYDSLDKVEQYCNSSSIKYYAFAEHSLDTNLDGSKKDRHVHFYISFFNARTESALRKELSNFFCGNVFTEIAYSQLKCCEYLIHKNDIDKYQYTEDIIFTNIPNCLIDNTSGNNLALSIITDLESGFTYRQMLSKYGREYVINHDKYLSFLNLMVSEESRLSCALETVDNILNEKYYKIDNFFLEEV